MYRCRVCGNEFREPILKQKSYFRIFILTIKAQWDRTIDRNSVYMKHCPFCDAPEDRLEAFIKEGEFDVESTPGDGEDIGEEDGLHV